MLQIWGLTGIGEIAEGDDLATIIGDAAERAEPGIVSGDIVVITSKVISKAEGRFVMADDREDAITAETVRVVASRTNPNTGSTTRIVENRLGIVQAAAGVDASNTPEGTVLLLPEDPDASARAIAAALRARFGGEIGVLVSDTLGRAWRDGQVDQAIGSAGVAVFEDLRGKVDTQGRPLVVTLPCVADEICSAAELVKGKAAGIPVAVVRGRGDLVGDLNLPGARTIPRTGPNDMFRKGYDEAHTDGYDAGYSAGYETAFEEARETSS